MGTLIRSPEQSHGEEKWSREQLGHAEIERKFLINPEEVPKLEPLESQRMVHGYLSAPDSDHELRISLIDEKCFAVMKSPGELSRREIEAELSPSAFFALWGKTARPRIHKTRYHLGGGLIIDFFEKDFEGRVVAEVEFDSEEDAKDFQPFPWMGDEVTDVPEFRNRRMIEPQPLETPPNPEVINEVAVLIRTFARSPWPVVIGIAGPTAGGKTTFAAQLKELCGPRTPIISLDDYNRGRDQLTRLNGGAHWRDWDSPIVYDTSQAASHLRQLKMGQSRIKKPVFDFKSSEVIDSEVIEPSPIIIVEGVYALNDNILPVLDIPIYVDAPVTTRLLRRLERDSERTDWSEQEIFRYFMEKAEPATVQLVEPQKKWARFVVNT